MAQPGSSWREFLTGLAGEGLAAVVAQESAFDEGGDVFLLVVGELVEGFELEAQAGVAGPHM